MTELFNELAGFNVCCTALTSFNQFISVPSMSQVSDEGFCQSDGVLRVTKGCPDQVFISPQGVSKVSHIISHKSGEGSSSFRASSLLSQHIMGHSCWLNQEIYRSSGSVRLFAQAL